MSCSGYVRCLLMHGVNYRNMIEPSRFGNALCFIIAFSTGKQSVDARPAGDGECSATPPFFSISVSF